MGDPGNVGTIVRSVVAFGGEGVICSPGTADPYGPKAMRAGMGAQFVLPVVIEVAPADLLARLGSLADAGGDSPRSWWPTRTRARTCVRPILAAGVIVVLGAERSGPGSDWQGARRVTSLRTVRFAQRGDGRHDPRL